MARISSKRVLDAYNKSDLSIKDKVVEKILELKIRHVERNMNGIQWDIETDISIGQFQALYWILGVNESL